MFVDLDRFKPINDVHGHAIGDQLLQVIATRLSSCIRDDSFAARLGGDEFAVLLEGPGGREGVAAAARRILHELSAPILVNGLKLTVGASIGIALCPEDGRDAAELLQRGDAAMLRAKEDRGAYKFFDSSIDEELKSKAALETELRAAIPNGDIVPYFQPVVRLDTGELAGFEVLARWPHRERGMISPVALHPGRGRGGSGRCDVLGAAGASLPQGARCAGRIHARRQHLAQPSARPMVPGESAAHAARNRLPGAAARNRSDRKRHDRRHCSARRPR